MTNRIITAKEKCLAGQALSGEEIISLLNIPTGSDEDMDMRAAARAVSAAVTGNRGYLWCAVGMDYVPCPMNCAFCSFGEKWGLIKDNHSVTLEEIIAHVKSYVAGGAAYIILRTTEFYSLDILLACIPKIRTAVPGDYGIIFNTGELDPSAARRAAEGGVYGIYHALRLREGIDTPFDPLIRLDTMQNTVNAGLSLVSLVEPVGREHTSEELADRFLTILSLGCSISGVMARFPVPGTPLGEEPILEEDRIAHIVAALRLSGGRCLQDVCAHPATPKIVAAGANMVVVESGAIPRDAVFSEHDWAGVDMEKARKLLISGGYHIAPCRYT